MSGPVFLATQCAGGSAGLWCCLVLTWWQVLMGPGWAPWMLQTWGLNCWGWWRPAPSPQGIEPGALPAALYLLTLPAAPAFLLAAPYLMGPRLCPHDVHEVPDSSSSFWRVSQCPLLAPSASWESLWRIQPRRDNEGLSHTLPCWHFNCRLFGSVSDYCLLESGVLVLTQPWMVRVASERHLINVCRLTCDCLGFDA